MRQTVSQNHAYLIRRNGIYYFSRRVPSDLQTRFNKERVTISLRTRSFTEAEKSAEALSDRLERYWDGLRLEVFHTKELGLSLVASNRGSCPEADSGWGKPRLFIHRLIVQELIPKFFTELLSRNHL